MPLPLAYVSRLQSKTGRTLRFLRTVRPIFLTIFLKANCE